MKRWLTLVFLPALLAAADWYWLNPLPAGNRNWDVCSTDSLNGYACGEMIISRTTDGGETWHLLDGYPQYGWTCMTFPERPEVGYVGGGYRAVHKTTDSGQTWFDVSPDLDVRSVHDLCFFDESVGFVGCGLYDEAAIARTTDGGATWDSLPIPDLLPVHALEQADETTVYAGCWRPQHGSQLWRSTDTGASWEKLFNWGEWIFAVDFPTPDIGYVGATDGRLLKTADGGASWDTLIPHPIEWPITQVEFRDDPDHGIVVFAGDHGDPALFLLRTSDGGATWDSIAPNTVVTRMSFPHDGMNGFAAGAYGMVSRTTDGGYTWDERSLSYRSGSRNYLFDVTFPTGASVGYAAGKRIVVKTTDGGASWRILPGLDTVRQDYYGAAFPVGDEHGWVASHHLVWETSDGGATWDTTFVVDDWLEQIQFPAGPVTGYIKSRSNGLWKTTDGGGTWTVTGHPASITGFHFVSNALGYSVHEGRVRKTTDGGVSWTEIRNVNNTFTDVFFATESIGWITGAGGNTGKTTDGGETWLPQFVVNTQGGYFNFIVFPDGPETGYIGGDHGQLWKTTDEGETWLSENTGTNLPLYDISFPEPGTGYSVGAIDVIIKTGFGGGIEEKAEGGGMKAELRIPTVMRAPELTQLDVRVMDATGRDVSERRAALAPGIYFVSEQGSRGQGSKGSSIRKVVVQR